MSISNQWKRILQSEDSINTRINIGTEFTLKYETSTMSISMPLNNKTISNYVLKKTQIKPIMEKMWEGKFNLINTVGLWSSVYQSIHFDLKRNDLRQFRFKLINAIMPGKEKLFHWRIATDQLCEYCKMIENYEHQYIDCPVLSILWTKINEAFKKCKIERQMNKLQYIVLGYKLQRNQLNLVSNRIRYL